MELDHLPEELDVRRFGYRWNVSLRSTGQVIGRFASRELALEAAQTEGRALGLDVVVNEADGTVHRWLAGVA